MKLQNANKAKAKYYFSLINLKRTQYNNSFQLCSVQNVLVTHLSALSILNNLIYTTIPLGKQYYFHHSHLTDEESEAQVREITCPKSHNSLFRELILNPSQFTRHAPNHYAMLPQVNKKGMVSQAYLFIAGQKYLGTKFLENSIICIYQES